MKDQNSVKKEGKYIRVDFVGDQSYEAVKAVADEIIPIAQEFISRDEWVFLYVDLSNMGKTTTGSRKASKEAYNYVPYDRIVITGASQFMQTFVNGVIRVSGRQSSPRVENDKDKALEWLLKEPDVLKI